MSNPDLTNVTWRKSRRSSPESNNCVEVSDLSPWRKSAHSGGGNNCVEIAGCEHTVAVRDSKNPDGPKLLLTRSQWATLVHALKDSA